MSFESERQLFFDFKSGLERNSVVLEEFLGACEQVNLRFDTGIYENRFIVGGVVEQLLGASMRAVGCNIDNVAKTRRGVDLLSPALGLGLSVKAQFKKGPEIRLVNTMGGSGADVVWAHATIFVVVGVGIGYADPDLVSNGLIARSDVLTLKIDSLKKLWSTYPKYLIDCDVPSKPAKSSQSRVASDVVAQDIMIDFTNLISHYRPERQNPPTSIS
jgi:hypothetical protein